MTSKLGAIERGAEELQEDLRSSEATGMIGVIELSRSVGELLALRTKETAPLSLCNALYQCPTF